MEMPRSGFGGAVTCTPSACSRSITPFQPEASAKAPCTRTTVGRDLSCGFVLMASPPYLPDFIHSLLEGRGKSVSHSKERDYALMPPSFREARFPETDFREHPFSADGWIEATLSLTDIRGHRRPLQRSAPLLSSRKAV